MVFKSSAKALDVLCFCQNKNCTIGDRGPLSLPPFLNKKRLRTNETLLKPKALRNQAEP